MRELPVIQLRRQGDRSARSVGNPDAEVPDVGRARRNQPGVEQAPRLPGIPLVDRIARPIELVGLVEVRTGLNRPLAAVGDFAAPVNHPAVRIPALQLQPDVEGVDRAAGEEMADAPRPDDHVHARGRPGRELRLGLVDRRGHLADVADEHRPLLLGFLAHRETRHRLRSRPFAGATHHAGAFSLFVDRRHGEDVHADESGLQERLDLFELGRILVHRGQGGIRRGEAVRVHLAVGVPPRIARRDQRHVAVGARRRLLRVVE